MKCADRLDQRGGCSRASSTPPSTVADGVVGGCCKRHSRSAWASSSCWATTAKGCGHRGRRSVAEKTNPDVVSTLTTSCYRSGRWLYKAGVEPGPRCAGRGDLAVSGCRPLFKSFLRLRAARWTVNEVNLHRLRVNHSTDYPRAMAPQSAPSDHCVRLTQNSEKAWVNSVCRNRVAGTC